MRRPNPVFSPEYRALVGVLIAARRAAGLSQRQVAARLGRASSHIALIERGQRRVDVLELFRLARALDALPAEIFARVCAVLTESLPDPEEVETPCVGTSIGYCIQNGSGANAETGDRGGGPGDGGAGGGRAASQGPTFGARPLRPR